MTARTSRAERLTMPLARDAIRVLAEARGGCLRPVQLRRTSLDTGQVDQQIIPCGSTLEATCPACAKRARNLRAEQCGDGWHLEDEPDPQQAEPDETQEYWLTLRAEAQVRRDQTEAQGDDTTGLDELIGELDDELARAGIRGTITRNTGTDGGQGGKRRSRSTRRRQDAPQLPKRPVTAGPPAACSPRRTARPTGRRCSSR